MAFSTRSLIVSYVKKRLHQNRNLMISNSKQIKPWIAFGLITTMIVVAYIALRWRGCKSVALSTCTCQLVYSRNISVPMTVPSVLFYEPKDSSGSESGVESGVGTYLDGHAEGYFLALGIMDEGIDRLNQSSAMLGALRSHMVRMRIFVLGREAGFGMACEQLRKIVEVNGEEAAKKCAAEMLDRFEKSTKDIASGAVPLEE